MKTHDTARIIGMGAYLPEKVLSNHDLEKIVDTSDEWIYTRTGMKERRIARDDEFTSDLGIEAAKKALANANISKDEIDYIIVTTLTPDYPTPSTAAIIQSKLGFKHTAAVDIQAACTGFLYGLSQAKAFIESGAYKNVLVISAEKFSSIVDYTDRSTCVLFGDGAAAAVVSGKGDGFAINHICLGADGDQCNLLMIPGGGTRNPASKETVDKRLHYIKMEGNETFKHAVRRMESAAKECLESCSLDKDQIQWMVAHQANVRIIDAIAKRFDMPMEKVYKTVHKYGNTSASALPIALTELLEKETVEEGDHLLLVAFGAGLTWGASLITKVKERVEALV